MMDTRLFREMLETDSTSGRERRLADFLAERMKTDRNRIERFDVETMASDVPDGCGIPQNLLFSWGVPKVLFCTHLDTVPPYIPPTLTETVREDGHQNADSNGWGSKDSVVYGRGTCDAKGQIFAMWEACKALEDLYQEGRTELLLETLKDLGPVSEELQQKILNEKNLDILKKWNKLAARAESIEEFLKEMEG